MVTKVNTQGFYSIIPEETDMELDESRIVFLPLNDILEKSISEWKSNPNIIAYELHNGLGGHGWIIYVIQGQDEWLNIMKIPECLKNFMVPAVAEGVEVFYLSNIEEQIEKKDGRMLTLSTGHISEFTAKSFEREQIQHGFPIYKKGEYGWFIYLNNWVRRATSNLSSPSDLGLVIRFAVSRGCNLLCLDRDGERVNELPYFEW